MRVESRRHDHDVGTVGFQCWAKNGVEDLQIFDITHSRRKRNILGVARPSSAARFIRLAGARIKGILVCTEEKHRRIFVEGVLGAVAMMHIPINNGHPLQTVPLLQIPGGDRDVIEETKPHRMFGFRMMTRGTDGTKGILDPAFHDGVGGGQGARHRHTRGVQ